MTTNTDNMRWSVVVPVLICLGGGAGSIVYMAGSVSTSVASLSKGMDDINKQEAITASATTHLADEVNHGATRMDAQDRNLDSINTKLGTMQQQLYELKEQVDRQPGRGK